jgi:hypothetical protein
LMCIPSVESVRSESLKSNKGSSFIVVTGPNEELNINEFASRVSYFTFRFGRKMGQTIARMFDQTFVTKPMKLPFSTLLGALRVGPMNGSITKDAA